MAIDTELRVRVRGGEAYPVRIGVGSVDGLSQVVPQGTAAAALIMDENVAALHGEMVTTRLRQCTPAVVGVRFRAGEASKSRETKAMIEDELFAAGLGRDSIVVALGGGVTTDLAGFVASTFVRGVPWIAIPTSLLAAVDASVGGKTGVNTPSGKNLVGTFYPPCAVLMDPNLIATLPAREVDNGLAEMVKHAVVADSAYLDRLEAQADCLRALDAEALVDAISRSVAIKARVVEADPRELDLRQVLNAGHTIGHALEKVSGYSLSHGRAVAIGLSVEAGMATLLGLMPQDERDRLRSALRRLELPLAPPPGKPPRQILEATRADKKTRRGRVRYALPRAIGKMATTDEGHSVAVPDDVVVSALDELRGCCA